MNPTSLRVRSLGNGVAGFLRGELCGNRSQYGAIYKNGLLSQDSEVKLKKLGLGKRHGEFKDPLFVYFSMKSRVRILIFCCELHKKAEK